MTDAPQGHPAARLGRHCAKAGLRLSHAQALFEVMYRTDAIAIEGGNVARAAKRAGIERAHMYRWAKRKTQKEQQ